MSSYSQSESLNRDSLYGLGRTLTNRNFKQAEIARLFLFVIQWETSPGECPRAGASATGQ